MKIACFGDSLTYGSIGYSYIRYINSEYKIVNKGVNGDTTVCAYRRLKRYIENHKNDDVDVYVIDIGTNDIMIPYLSTLSPLWSILMTPRGKMKKCIADNKLFETEYRRIIKLVLSRNKTVITVGLPVIELKEFSNESVQKRNLIIKRLAAGYRIPFVDTALLQQQIVENISFSYSWKHTHALRIIDELVMLALPYSKDWYSKLRRLELTVDGVHFNSRSAKLIGDAINSCVTM